MAVRYWSLGQCAVMATMACLAGCKESRDRARLAKPAQTGTISPVATRSTDSTEERDHQVSHAQRPPARPTQSCEKICTNTLPLQCETAGECAAQCQEMRDTPVCGPQMRQVLSCLSEQPSSHWECTEGSSAIKPGYCESEQAAFAECLRREIAALR